MLKRLPLLNLLWLNTSGSHFPQLQTFFQSSISFFSYNPISTFCTLILWFLHLQYRRCSLVKMLNDQFMKTKYGSNQETIYPVADWYLKYCHSNLVYLYIYKSDFSYLQRSRSCLKLYGTEFSIPKLNANLQRHLQKLLNMSSSLLKNVVRWSKTR